MNSPSPAIVAQNSVRRLPRVALWLFALAYVLPGFWGRAPWKSADMTAFGYMGALARGESPWMAPQLLGLAPTTDALLPYWLGASVIRLSPSWLPADLAVRTGFAACLGLCLVATWYAVYYLARSPLAQPVTFAFGGEAQVPDYARAMADGGLLATIACLGLAQLSHETTPAALQLCCLALAFYAFSALPYLLWAPLACAVLGLGGLALSGAPTVAFLAAAGAWLVHVLDRPGPSRRAEKSSGAAHTNADTDADLSRHTAVFWVLGVLTAAVALLCIQLDLWRWRIEWPQASRGDWRGLARLFLWFTWPAWPLALWSVWRWRFQLWQMLHGRMIRHLALPLWFVAITFADTLLTTSGDRALLLSLPALATLATFALPTLGRGVAALIDWFTLVFFSGCAFTIWVVWIAMQTGVPPQPAANVVRLVPGFQASFSFWALFFAVAATAAWAWLVNWRIGRHPKAIWKSLVLPASGAALCWLLLMTLWLPLLDFARSYTAMTGQISAVVGKPVCVEVHSLDRGQIAAFQFHAGLNLRPATRQAGCPWLLVDRDRVDTLANVVDMKHWTPQYFGYRPTDRDDDVLLYRRTVRP